VRDANFGFSAAEWGDYASREARWRLRGDRLRMDPFMRQAEPCVAMSRAQHPDLAAFGALVSFRHDRVMPLTVMAVEVADRLRGAELTYREAGRTASVLPAGYHHLRRNDLIGSGRRPSLVPQLPCSAGRCTRPAGIRIDLASHHGCRTPKTLSRATAKVMHTARQHIGDPQWDPDG
jgi:hypothetical protein